MLSYKEYKQLHESLDSSIALGVKPFQSLGKLQSKWDEMGMPTYAMKKKRAKKYMGAEMPGDHDREFEDFENERKPRKLKGDFEDEENPDGDEFADDDGDEDNDEFDDDGDEFSSDTDEDFDDEDGEDDEFGGDEFEGDDEEVAPRPKKKPKMPMKNPQMDMGPPMEKGLGMKMMKKGKKHFHDDDEAEEYEVVDDHDHDDFDDVEEDADVDDEDHDKDCSCKSCSKCMKKGKKHMGKKAVKESKEFFNTLKDWTGFSFFDINKDGSFREDMIFPPEDVNQDIESPVAGQPGFAPQGKVGSDNPSGSFFEWTTKHRKAAKTRLKKKKIK